MRKALTGLMMTAALVAAPLTAQEHPAGQPADSSGQLQTMQGMHGQGGMMGMHQGGMMGMRGQGGMMMGAARGPAMMLRLGDSLALTDEQVERLESLREEAWAGARQHMMQATQTMGAARDLLEGEAPDLDGYEAQLREAANHMVLARTAMARAAVEARAVLTPEQRDRFTLARTMMHEMHGDALMQGMMPGMMRSHDSRESGPAGDGH